MFCNCTIKYFLLKLSYVFLSSVKSKFEALHQLNRRTTVKIIMEPGTENPKLFDVNSACDKNIDTYKYTDPLPR